MVESRWEKPSPSKEKPSSVVCAQEVVPVLTAAFLSCTTRAKRSCCILWESLGLVPYRDSSRLWISIALLHGSPSPAGHRQGGGRQSLSCSGSTLCSLCAGSLTEPGQKEALSSVLCWEELGSKEVPEARSVRRGNIFYGSNSQRWIKGTSFRAPRTFFVAEIGAA